MSWNDYTVYVPGSSSNVSLGAIGREFKNSSSTSQISLSQLYGGTNGQPGIPASGQINIGAFVGKRYQAVPYYYSAPLGTQTLNMPYGHYILCLITACSDGGGGGAGANEYTYGFSSGGGGGGAGALWNSNTDFVPYKFSSLGASYTTYIGAGGAGVPPGGGLDNYGGSESLIYGNPGGGTYVYNNSNSTMILELSGGSGGSCGQYTPSIYGGYHAGTGGGGGTLITGISGGTAFPGGSGSNVSNAYAQYTGAPGGTSPIDGEGGLSSGWSLYAETYYSGYNGGVYGGGGGGGSGSTGYSNKYGGYPVDPAGFMIIGGGGGNGAYGYIDIQFNWE